MLRPRRQLQIWALLLLLSGGDAAAQTPPEKADAARLFEEGKALMKKQDYAAACPKLAESLRLRDLVDTQFRLGQCYEHIGRPASALKLYKAVVEQVAKDPPGEQRKKREATVRKSIEDVSRDLPIVVVSLDAVSAVQGVQVRLDGEVLDAAALKAGVAVDLGKHQVQVTAPDKQSWSSEAVVNGGGRNEVVVPALKDVEPASEVVPSMKAPALPETPSAPVPSAIAKPTEDPVHAAPPAGITGRQVGSVSAGLAGVVAIGVGAGLGVAWLRERQTYLALQDAIRGGTAPCAREACISAQNQHLNDLQTLLVGEAIGFAAGGLGLATAAILWLTGPRSGSPKAAPAPRVSVGTSGALVSVGGQF